MWCRTLIALVRDGAGRPAQTTAMLEDISDRKRVEADLLHRTLHDALIRLPEPAALPRTTGGDTGAALRLRGRRRCLPPSLHDLTCRERRRWRSRSPPRR